MREENCEESWLGPSVTAAVAMRYERMWQAMESLGQRSRGNWSNPSRRTYYWDTRLASSPGALTASSGRSPIRSLSRARSDTRAWSCSKSPSEQAAGREVGGVVWDLGQPEFGTQV
jgi:hypothetical protein